MFENIIGQQTTINNLKQDIQEGHLPGSLLFHGPEYGGKLSTALEIVRGLSCEKAGTWNCSCHSCEKQRLLIGQNLLLLGSRDCLTEISASADVLLRTGKLFARYLFIRAVRKQLKGFDPVLWEGDSSKINAFQSTISSLEEKLNDFHPDIPLPVSKKLERQLKGIIKLCTKLASASKSENIPINHIRKAIYWAHHSSGGLKKVIIINNADKMQDSSRNSLLKILEEPPESVYIILLTTRKGALLRTILSRVRPYPFFKRGKEDSRIILSKIFREETPEFNLLKDYFLAWKDLNPAAIRNLAGKFIRHILECRAPVDNILVEMNELVSSKMPKEAFASFFEELFHIFESLLISRENKEKPVALRNIEGWTKILKEASYHLEFLNISPKNLLESIYYKMRTQL